MRVFILFIALLGAAASAAPASALTLTQGHGDVGIWYLPGQGYELMLSSGESWRSDPSLATIVVGQQARETVPESLATPASGLTVGDSFWKLPQSATEAAIEGSPWLGLQIHGGPLGSDGASSSSANVSLQLVSATGPGQFLMWQDLEPNLYGLGGPGGPGFESRSDLFASPAAAFNSAASAGNHVDCWQHMHTHANWGFTAPGEYAVTLSLTGETAEDGAFSDQATFRFLVEDSSLGVPRFGDLTGDGIVTQADLTRLSQSFGTTDGATPATGDLNGDGRVGLRDLMLLRNELGGRPQTPATTDWNSTTLPTIGSQLEGATIGGPIPSLDFSTASSIAAAAAVPEPGALALAGCGGLTMAWLSRRRRKQ